MNRDLGVKGIEYVERLEPTAKNLFGFMRNIKRVDNIIVCVGWLQRDLLISGCIQVLG